MVHTNSMLCIVLLEIGDLILSHQKSQTVMLSPKFSLSIRFLRRIVDQSQFAQLTARSKLLAHRYVPLAAIF